MKSNVLLVFSLVSGFVFSEMVPVFPQEVQVTSEGIFLFVEGNWIPAGIFREGEEFYIKPSYQKISYGFTWQCDCGAWNGGLAKTCISCGRGRYDYTDPGE